MKSVAVEVSDTPVLVADAAEHFKPLGLSVINSGPDQVFLGGADVDDATGFPLTTDDIGYEQDFEANSADKLYAVCSSGNTATLLVLRTGS